MKNLFAKYPKLINLWPPLLGAGIRLKRQSADLRVVDVEMRRTRLNRNYVGVHFGGSLFAMTDPFYMIMVANALGRGYVVWDKAANIRFKRPGLTTVTAHFELTDARLAEIRTATDRDGAYDAVFNVDVVDPAGNVVASVERVIYCATKEADRLRKEKRAGLAARTSKALQ